MSLQVWLPLTKDLRNQGLSNITSSGTPAYKNSGKLGPNPLDLNTRINFNCANLANKTTFSIAFWAKVNADISLTTNWVDVIGFTDATSGGTTGQLRWETCYGSGYENRGISGHDNATYAITTGPNGGSTAGGKGVWNHIVCTVENSVAVKEYRDGILSGTYTSNGGHLTGAFWIGETGKINGEIQDVRIYDHCLSPQEVKRISQGLVLHYTLSDGYIENTLNYLGEKSDTFTSWGSYGFGSKGTITIDTTQTAVCGGQVAKLTNKTTETSNSTVEMATTFTSVASTVMQKNEKFTISAYVKGNGSTIGKSCFLHIYNTNGTNTSSTGGSSIVLTDKWKRVFYTYTWPYDAPSNNSGNCYVCVSMKGGESIYICNVQVEKKDHATSFTNNSRTNSLIYDSSGFCNNGTISGALAISNDTPKYSYSIQMPAATTITHDRCLDNTNQEWSCAAWVKPTTAGNYQNLNNFNESNRLYHGTYPLLYLNSGTNDYYNYGNLALPANQWSHIVFVFQNLTGTKLIYINGENHTNTSGPNKTSTPKGIPDTVIIGGGNYEGGLCDYREYATALSASDIKTLYDITNYEA